MFECSKVQLFYIPVYQHHGIATQNLQNWHCGLQYNILVWWWHESNLKSYHYSYYSFLTCQIFVQHSQIGNAGLFSFANAILAKVIKFEESLIQNYLCTLLYEGNVELCLFWVSPTYIIFIAHSVRGFSMF